MPVTTVALPAWLLALLLTACQQSAVEIPDLRVDTLSVKRDVIDSDTIVLAYPVRHRDLRSLAVRVSYRPTPLNVEEMEITLRTVMVLKGPPLPAEIRFRYYDARGYILMGMPAGPSGRLGERSIFFLRHSS